MADAYDDAVVAILACIRINGSCVATSISAIDEILRSRFTLRELAKPSRSRGFAATPLVIHLPVNYDWPHDRLQRAEAEIAALRQLLADHQSSNSGSASSSIAEPPESGTASPGVSYSK